MTTRGSRFLTMCEGGNVRSVALAFVLKDNYGQDAIACSWRSNTRETRNMLYAWADYIVVMQPHFAEHVPGEFAPKVRCVDVGPDSYGTPMHGDLLAELNKVVRGWRDRGWKI